jgi:hypothetical protein
MEAELNKRERVCALDFLFFSLFLCILCSVVYNLPLLPFALEQYIQSNNELYFFMAKAFHSRQYVLQDHAALLLYTWFMLLTKALLLWPVLNDCSWERHCFALVLYYYVDCNVRCQRILTQYIWSFKSLFHLFMCNVFFSIMLVWFPLHHFFFAFWPRNWKGRKRQHPEVHFTLILILK